MTKAASQPKPELLAPAGSLEAFFAAMEHGADAVYVGLKEFSARAKAKNVSLAELEQMLGYAHARQKQVYLTLNTLVKERELPQLVDILAAVEAMGIDAVILQDLAVWRLAKRHFPGLELHGSTQLTIHNAAGAKQLEAMGFTRVVLARELSLTEIAAIRRQTTIGLEHFVHGAHCFSLSGQCSFSSWLGGMSGNRGRCAQPCRRRYRYRNQDGYYFSPNDLSAIDLLPDLASAGIMSLKIEGRMKSAEYVANVVQAYRQALDAPAAQRVSAIKAAKELLRDSFGRLPTRGFLPDGQPTDIVNPGLHGATGRLIGRVEQCRDRSLTFTTKDALHLGDRIRIQPATDKPGTAFTIRDLRLGRKPVTRADAGNTVTVGIPPDTRFVKGDAVFKVSSGKAFSMSANACRKRLAEITPGESRIDLSIHMPDNGHLQVTARSGGLQLDRRYPVESFPATDRPLDAEILRKVFGKTGQHPFALSQFDCKGLPAVVIPPSRLNAIRREFYTELGEAIAYQRQTVQKQHRQQARADLLPPAPAAVVEQPVLTVAISAVKDLSVLKTPGVHDVILPLTPGSHARLSPHQAVLREPERLIWDLPLALFDRDWPVWQDEVERLIAAGFRRFRLQNLGQIQLFAGHDDLELEAGYRLFTVNSQAALAWRELGLVGTTLFVEDDRANFAELLKRAPGPDMAVTVYANLPMMVSRVALRGVKPDRPLVSDRGEAYRVESRQGVTTIRPEQDFSLLGHLHELQALGCHRFVLDLAHLGPHSAAGRQVLAAAQQDGAVDGTSTFNYLQEMI